MDGAAVDPGLIAIALAVVLGVGLAAAAGFRVFVPLLGAALAVRFGILTAPESLAWIGSTPAIILLAVACAAELLATLIPAVDHAIDALASPMAAAAGALLMAIQMWSHLGLEVPDSVTSMDGVREVHAMSPLLFWSLAIIVGGGAALGTHAAAAIGRAGSTVTTAGLGNPIYAFAESLASIVATALAIVVPACCAIVAIPIVLLGVVWMVRRRRTLRQRRQGIVTAAVLGCGAALVGGVSGCLHAGPRGTSECGPASAARPPNLVVIYCDDMGWGDVPGFELAGHSPAWYTKLMPNLVALASEGAVFRHYYSAQPVCSASRAALLTGCYPNRVGIHGALFPDARIGIAPEERTLAEMLRQAGYATLIAGKWHLGHLPEFNPTVHGFDEYYGIPYSNDMWPLRFGRKGFPELPLYEGTGVSELVLTLEDQGLLTGKLTQRACEFIRREAADGQPFFAYLPHPQPHAPIAAGPDFQPAQRAELYGAVMREIDWSVGEVMRVLSDSGVADNTILVFTSDNGPWLSFGTDAGVTGGLREGKGTTFEGGVREPCIVRWPGHVPAGCVSDVPWMSIDLFATMAAIVGAPAPAGDRPIDGLDVRHVWSCEAGAESPHQALWFYYHTNHLEGVRSGKWKLSLPRKSRVVKGAPGVVDGKEAEYVEVDVPLALFDLDVDPAESVDVSALHPEVVAELMVHVEAARADLGDALTDRTGVGRREPGRASPVVTP